MGGPNRVWYGNGCNLDEAYEFLGGLGLLGAVRSDKEKLPALHASTLNAFIQSGKTKRATRTNASYGGARSLPVSASILGNGHPAKFISIDRGLLGNHTACTKERFFFCLDEAAPRHAPLPEDADVSGGKLWTWLPLTPQQASIFGWGDLLDAPEVAQKKCSVPDEGLASLGEQADGALRCVGPVNGYAVTLPDGVPSRLRYVFLGSGAGDAAQVRTQFRISARWNATDPTEHIRFGGRRVAEHFASRPHCVLPWENGAREVLLGNQVAQSVRAQMSSEDSTTQALHANAAGMQGILAALIAVLELAGGGGQFDSDGHLVVQLAHIQCAWRLTEAALGIREAFRGALDLDRPSVDGVGDEAAALAAPVRGHYGPEVFAEPLATQASVPGPAPPAPVEGAGGLLQDATGATGSGEAGVPIPGAGAAALPANAPHRPVPCASAGAFSHRDDAEPEAEVVPLGFEDVLAEGPFDDKGFGADGAMVFPSVGGAQLFKDRQLLRRVLLSGRSQWSVNQLVDAFAMCKPLPQGAAKATKRARVRPKKADVVAVLRAALAQYPRLAAFDGDGQEFVTLKGWSTSEVGRIMYHNDLMNCARVSLREVSEKRALFFDKSPAPLPAPAAGRNGGQPASAFAAAQHARLRPSRPRRSPTPPDGVAPPENQAYTVEVHAEFELSGDESVLTFKLADHTKISNLKHSWCQEVCVDMDTVCFKMADGRLLLPSDTPQHLGWEPGITPTKVRALPVE